MRTTALAGWFGGNRLLAPMVGRELTGCNWVGIPFAGSMAEVPHIAARTILISDSHRAIINLARVIADPRLRPQLIRHLDRILFHPDELKEAQTICRQQGDAPDPMTMPCLEWAVDYFVCCWMGRAGLGGIEDEFYGRPAFRWNASGGDSVVRYRSALRSIASWGEVFRRCSFETLDAFDFLTRCEDRVGHGIYADPPFPTVGRRYKHNCGKTDEEERAWHTKLRDHVARFEKTRCVLRFYDHELIRELYPEGHWTWLRLKGRKQSNEAAPEVLILNGQSLSGGSTAGMFDDVKEDS